MKLKTLYYFCITSQRGARTIADCRSEIYDLRIFIVQKSTIENQKSTIILAEIIPIEPGTGNAV